MGPFDRLGGGGAGSESAPRLTPGLLVVLCVLMTLNPIVANMYLPALGIMADDLGTNIVGIQLALTAFFLGVAVGQLVVGALSDSLGRRRVLVLSFVVLTAASAFVAAAPTLEVMILGRVLQGFGAAASVVIVRAIVSDIGVGTQVSRAYSILIGTLAVGPLLASLSGTVLLQISGWRAILVGTVVASVAYLVIAVVAIPESLPAARRAPFRLPSMIGSYGRLLRDPAYVGFALTMAFVFAGLTVYVNATSFVAQDVLGLSPWGFWLIFTAYGLSVFAGGWANAPLSARYGSRTMLAVDLAVAIITTAALVVITWLGALTVATYAVLIVVCCAAVAGVMANATTLTLGRVSFAAGSGAALMGCVQFALGALAAPIGGLAGPETALPMTLGMLGCFVLSLVASVFGRHHERRAPRGFPTDENPPALPGGGAAP
ncbi:MAG: multidrug effflux MFS transporter [Microbacterium sp.]|uniref:multidrug effflux MFS transporter n=1 Tax=Microbacterium sp. TaxID=51671 RepID=UPI002718FB07|nr:multidrug effflux MFS transporter [Microbacterium sp.]MDO8383047.1 multidrug effflux MFS transporter [Microbacterium sp.]